MSSDGKEKEDYSSTGEGQKTGAEEALNKYIRIQEADEVLRECVILTRTSMLQTFGNWKSFFLSKYECLSTAGKCVQNPATVPSSS